MALFCFTLTCRCPDCLSLEGSIHKHGTWGQWEHCPSRSPSIARSPDRSYCAHIASIRPSLGRNCPPHSRLCCHCNRTWRTWSCPASTAASRPRTYRTDCRVYRSGNAGTQRLLTATGSCRTRRMGRRSGTDTFCSLVGFLVAHHRNILSGFRIKYVFLMYFSILKQFVNIRFCWL